jgi:transcriptional regulator with XRE-family HTH domain
MELSTAEKIRVILKRKAMTVSQLAEMTGQSRQNLSQKLERNNFGEEELRMFAEKMGVRYESYFVMENGDRL